MVRPSRGYTLRELLVAAAMLVAVVAVFAPAFRHAREVARQDVCLGNMRVLSRGLLNYAHDWDEHLPLARFDTPSGAAFSWRWAVGPYLQFANVWRCPSAPETCSPAMARGSRLAAGDEWRALSSYAFNHVHAAPGPPTPPSGRAPGELVATVMLVEYTGPALLENPGGSNQHGWRRADEAVTRHEGKAPVAFGDGRIKPADVVTSHASYCLPNECIWAVEPTEKAP